MMAKNNGLTFMTPQHQPSICPHCGAKAVYKAATIGDMPGAVISCTECHAQSPIVSATSYLYYKGQPDVTLSIGQATEEAREAWDARVKESLDRVERMLIRNYRQLNEEQQFEMLTRAADLAAAARASRQPHLHLVSDSSDKEGDGSDE